MENTTSKTPETRSLQILENYEGSNNYILNLKHKKHNSKSYPHKKSSGICNILPFKTTKGCKKMGKT